MQACDLRAEEGPIAGVGTGQGKHHASGGNGQTGPSLQNPLLHSANSSTPVNLEWHATG